MLIVGHSPVHGFRSTTQHEPSLAESAAEVNLQQQPQQDEIQSSSTQPQSEDSQNLLNDQMNAIAYMLREYEDENSKSSQKLPTPSTKQQEEGYAVALSSFTPNKSKQHEQLTFAKGDIIRVLQRRSGVWWLGELNGKQGDFATAYCQLVKPEDVKIDPQTGARSFVRNQQNTTNNNNNNKSSNNNDNKNNNNKEGTQFSSTQPQSQDSQNLLKKQEVLVETTAQKKLIASQSIS